MLKKLFKNFKLRKDIDFKEQYIKNKFPYLLLIVLLGVTLRLYDLGEENLWFDEVGSVDLALRPLSVVFFKYYNSPLYFWILKFWIKLFGVSETALRSLSAIFGVASIFLIYKIAKLLFNKKIGLFSAFLLSISPLHIFYSQEARNYSLLIFLTLFSMLLFIKLVKEERKSTYIYYTVVSILLLYTLLHSILIIFVQNLFLIFKKIRFTKRWVLAQSIILLFFLLWFIPIIHYALTEPWIKVSTSWISKPRLDILFETFRAFSFGGESYGGADIHIPMKNLQILQGLFYIFCFLFFLGISKSRFWNKKIKFKRDSEAIFLLSMGLFLSILIPFFFSLVFFPVYVIRYVIFALPAFLIIIAVGLSRIDNRINQGLVTLSITIVTIFALHIYYKEDLKIAWRDAINYIDKNIEKNDVIIVSLAKEARLFSYYGRNGLRFSKDRVLRIDKQLGSQLVTGGFIYNGFANKLIGINDTEQLKQINNSINFINVWLAISRWSIATDGTQIVQYMNNSYKNVQHKTYPGITVYHYVHYNKF